MDRLIEDEMRVRYEREVKNEERGTLTLLVGHVTTNVAEPRQLNRIAQYMIAIVSARLLNHELQDWMRTHFFMHSFAASRVSKRTAMNSFDLSGDCFTKSKEHAPILSSKKSLQIDALFDHD